MVCQYCNKRLGLIQRLKGMSFCSLEHQELHFGLSFERLRDSVTEITPNKEPKQSRYKPDWMLAKEEKPQTAPPQAEATVEQTPVQQVAELQASDATGELAPTLEIASLVEAVGTSVGIELPEAPFLPELPARQDQPESPLKIYAEALVSAAVQLPASPKQKVPLRVTPSRVSDVVPARPPVQVTPVVSQPTFRSVPQVPQGYPPVVISASATLVLDAKDAKLLALPMGEPYRGKGPVPPPQSAAIETPLRQPLLLTRQGEQQSTSVFDRPPQAPACDPVWKGRLGRGPALPQVTGVLRPQRDVVRLAPTAHHENLAALSGFPFFAEEPGIPVPQKELQALAPAPYFPPTIAPRRAVNTGMPPFMSSAVTWAGGSSPLALECTTPVSCEPSFSQVDSTWLPTAVASQLPRGVVVPLSEPIGLSRATDAIPLAHSSATNLPPEVETAPAAGSAVPFLLLPGPSSMAAPILSIWSSTRPLLREPSRLPGPGSELQSALGVAHLQPSSPSPMSLVTWSQSLSTSIPARSPSNLGGPAPIVMSAYRGCPQALRPWSPGGRVHRITPLLPLPNEVVWAPTPPMQASLRPPVIHPIRPSGEGTAPPPLAGVRVQPASMSVLPSAASEAQSVRQTHPHAAPFCMSSFEDAVMTACIDMAHHASTAVGELSPESSPILPLFSTQQHAPAICLAPSSHRGWWDAMPPAETVSTVHLFSSLQRLPGSVTANVGPIGLTVSKSPLSKVDLAFVP